MKNILIVILSMAVFSNTAFAECDFSTGITKTDSGYLYTKECNVKVGEMKQDLLISQDQIDKLNKALDLKDLAISKSDARADLWMNTAFKVEERVDTIDEMRKTNQWMYFGLGILTVFAAGYAASQVYRR